MRILVTGGPVHGRIDAVKIVTNTFKGGLMAQLANEISKEAGRDAEIVYLCTKDSVQPIWYYGMPGKCEIIHHDGIHDYMAKVLEIAPSCDGVVLGAAVANLIPKHTLMGKFPSHNYAPGDTINLEFTIAPRVIDEVKKVAPKTKLFGFKLLAGVEHDELIKAAYGVLLESKATYVFANQMKSLNDLQWITKERAVIPMKRSALAKTIIQGIQDEYYKTELGRTEWLGTQETNDKFEYLLDLYGMSFTTTPEGYIFGTIAVRDNPTMPGFLTTGRGKNELEDKAFVSHVDHVRKIVTTTTPRKATLNAPLLDWIFQFDHRVESIVHTHIQNTDLPTLKYAPSGTVRDSIRMEIDNIIGSGVGGFNILGHGSYVVGMRK